MAGRRKGVRKVKMSAGESDPPASDLLAFHALVFSVSLPFGRLPRRLGQRRQGYFAERRMPNALFACGLVVSLAFACG